MNGDMRCVKERKIQGGKRKFKRERAGYKSKRRRMM